MLLREVVRARDENLDDSNIGPVSLGFKRIVPQGRFASGLAEDAVANGRCAAGRRRHLRKHAEASVEGMHHARKARRHSGFGGAAGSIRSGVPRMMLAGYMHFSFQDCGIAPGPAAHVAVGVRCSPAETRKKINKDTGVH